MYRPQLTSTEVDKRCHGVRLLSEVLHRLVGFRFKEKEGCYNLVFNILAFCNKSLHKVVFY